MPRIDAYANLAAGDIAEQDELILWDVSASAVKNATVAAFASHALFSAEFERRTRFDIRDYGAVVDGLEISGCAMTAGSAVLDSSSYTFTDADIGKVIGVEGAGYDSPSFDTNANDGKLISTIASVSGGNATLNDVAVNTVSGAVAAFGTPDDDAIAAAQTAAVAAGGGTVFFPAGRTIVTQPLPVEDYVSWAGVHRDVSWVEVIFSAPGTGPASAGQTDWLSCTGRSSANPLTGASFHDFGIEARFHIRPGGYTAPIKALNIFHVRRCSIERMNVWNTGATAIPFDHAYEAVFILNNIVKNPGRLFDGSAGGSGIGIGTHNTGSPEPGLVFGNAILGVADTATSPNGNNGIFVEGQSGSSATTPSQGYRIIGNYVQGMTVGIADEGTSGTIISLNTINKCVTGVRIADGGVTGAYPGIDTLVQSNTIINSVAPSGLATDGTGILVSTNASDNVGVRPRIVDNNVLDSAGRGIRISAGTNVLDGMEIRDNKVRGAQRSAIHISSTGVQITNPTVEGNRLEEYGLAAVSGDFYALYISADLDRPAIRNNRAFGTYGLFIATGADLTGVGQIVGNEFNTVTVSGTIDYATIKVTGNAGWPTWIDAASVLWVRPQDFYTITGTATAGHTQRFPFLAFPDAATTTVSATVPLPGDWNTCRAEAVWTAVSGATGNVTWRFDYSTFTTSDTIAQPPSGTELPTAAPSATPAVTSVKTGITVDKPFLVMNLSRIGAAGTDTSTADARLLGVRLVRTA